jgi:hypothetical protein
LITYDLNKSGQNYSLLYEVIKTLGPHIHALESVWFLDSRLATNQVREKLRVVMDSNDLLFVTPVRNDYSGYLNDDAIEWLPNHVI